MKIQQTLPEGISSAIRSKTYFPKYLNENTISASEVIIEALKKAAERTAEVAKEGAKALENVVKNPAENAEKLVNKAASGATKVFEGAAEGASTGLSLGANLAGKIAESYGSIGEIIAGAVAITAFTTTTVAAFGAAEPITNAIEQAAKDTGTTILQSIQTAGDVALNLDQKLQAIDIDAYRRYGAALDLLFDEYTIKRNKDITKEETINACNAREALKPMIPQTPWSKLYGGLKDIVSGKTCEELYLQKGATELLYSTFVYDKNVMHYRRLFANTLTEKLDKEIRPEDITTEFLTSFVKYCREHDCKYNDSIHEFYLHEHPENAYSPMAGELNVKSEL
jgi:hypothetical protein